MDIRIGIGYDVHRFAEERRLFLGGIEFENSPGLDGHSDADVALHAVIDAVLGAVGAGDIGSWFPDTDSAYKDADSRELLRTVMQSEALRNWQLVNLDMVIIAQQPKILPMVGRMKESLSELLNSTPERISIKGKTTEKLGFTGRGEGIAVQAAVLMQRI